MSQIIIRNLGSKIKEQLQIQASNNGNSLSEEIRQILRKALQKKRSGLGSKIASRFNEVDFDIPELKGQTLHDPINDYS